MQQRLSGLAVDLAQVAFEAGQVILRHYETGTETRLKEDSSPVTLADEEAEAVILAHLHLLLPKIPIIAEEAMAAGEKPVPGDRFFLVDPLDGTKEFIKHNGEFTVNIALVESGAPVCGVVLAPAQGRAFVGDIAGETRAAFELSAPVGKPFDIAGAKPIHARPAPADGLVAVVSRSHRDPKTEEYLAQYKIKSMRDAGSSLKFCLVATGEADLYPRLGRTMEWDTAAGHAVLSAAGGTVTQLDGSPFFYGKVAQDFANPYFVARGLT
jgi:3'(2'), 5'-bisphosphate nucleotidase